MTTYVTENMICDCCGGVVLGETYIQNRYQQPKLHLESMHVAGDICEECRPVLQDAFDNIAELQRMKRGPQEAELPEAKAIRLEEENQALRKKIASMQVNPTPPTLPPLPISRPYGAPDQTTMQEVMYRAKMEELERKRLGAMYPQVNYGAGTNTAPTVVKKVA